MKASLKRTIDKQRADREKFIYSQGDEVEVKTNSRKEVKRDNSMDEERKSVKKASCYLPLDLWLKYKTFELDQAKQGKSVSLNGLIVDLLTRRLKDY